MDPYIFEREAAFVRHNVLSRDDVQQLHLDGPELRLRYGSAGDARLPVLVFVHGTPGNWHSFARFMVRDDLRGRARIVSVDRPGWGGSQLPDGGLETDFQRQAAHLAPLLAQLRRESGGAPLVLIGHSLGATIAASVAVHHPQLVDALLLLSGGFDPRLEDPRWYNYLADSAALGWVVPGTLAHSNVEMMQKGRQVRKLAERLPQLRLPITVLHGSMDLLAHADNLDYARSIWPDAHVLPIRGQGHFVHLEQQDLVAAEALRLLDGLERP